MRPPESRATRQDRRRPHVAVVAVLLILAHLAPVPVYAQNSLLSRARAHMAHGNPQAAYDVLTPHESSLADDAGFDYLLGTAAMDSGHLTHSIFALERVLAVEPENVLARAEIARVYLMLGELRTSRQEFETVSKSEDLPPFACRDCLQPSSVLRKPHTFCVVLAIQPKPCPPQASVLGSESRQELSCR